MNQDPIVQDIISHVRTSGTKFSDWYAGITSDPKSRLFTEHSVKEQNGWWIFRYASAGSHARLVEDYLLNVIGFDGGTGGGDPSSICVYAYLKTQSTVQ